MQALLVLHKKNARDLRRPAGYIESAHHDGGWPVAIIVIQSLCYVTLDISNCGYICRYMSLRRNFCIQVFVGYTIIVISLSRVYHVYGGFMAGVFRMNIYFAFVLHY